MRGGDKPTQQSTLARRVRELEMMVQVSRTLNSTLDVEALLILTFTLPSAWEDAIARGESGRP